MPDVEYLTAKVDKLNVCSEGGFFKAHVDTPRGSNMVPTLVVVLPTEFSGDELDVRHQDIFSTYKWSLNDDEHSHDLAPGKLLRWTAFFSNCEHEILPVTSGTRVTVTYSLYYNNADVDRRRYINVGAFEKQLVSALALPQFYPEGAVLGFRQVYR